MTSVPFEDRLFEVEMGKAEAPKAASGAPPYEPRMMPKLLL
jgi:hypothetical protein